MRRARGYLFFILTIPAAGAVYVPWLILAATGATIQPSGWPGAGLIVVGLAIEVWCFWTFAVAGRGTPAPWDPPKRVVAEGPFRWVRNPIYIGAFIVVLGESWLFLSVPLLVYAILVALGIHVVVIAYEEPRLRERFGAEYEEYLRNVPRWIPRP